MDKKYWFYIDSYVYVSMKGNHVLLYNPLNGEALEYEGQLEIVRLLKRLSSGDNLWVTALKRSQLNSEAIGKFVNDVRSKFMGDLLDASISKAKPLQMQPSINIQSDVTKLKDMNHRSIGENLMEYLTELTLYVTDKCRLDCGFCADAFKQFPCCTRFFTRSKKYSSQGRKEMGFPLIRQILREMENSFLEIIHIDGGNILSYSDMNALLPLLAIKECRKVFYLHYLNLSKDLRQAEKLTIPNSRIQVLVSFPIQQEALLQIISWAKEKEYSVQFAFVIDSDDQFNEVETLTKSLEIEDYIYRPFYNGDNLDFFKDNIFVTKESLLEARPNKKTRDTRKIINALDFGTLSILPGGEIHANVNRPAIGMAGKDSIFDCIATELEKGTSWRRVRRHVRPCKSCVYDALCPPLSNYEYALKQNNLCHIYAGQSPTDIK